MNLSYNYYSQLEQPRLFLANPQKSYITEIFDAKHVKIKCNLANVSELTFTVYQGVLENKCEFYDQLLNKKLVEVQNLGWFQIDDVRPKQDKSVGCEVNEIICLSLENELVNKKLDYLEGVYSLYDFNNPEFSILHQIVANTNWKIGHIDNDLLTKKRVFSEENLKKYNFLTTTISKSFECIFRFDTYTKSINAYTLDNIGDLTDVIIHARNILESYNQECRGSDLITKMRVKGGDGFDIREINPSSTNELVNLDYFLVPISQGGWMSDDLVVAYNNFKLVHSNLIEQHTTNVDLLKTHIKNLTTLNVELTELKGLKVGQEEVQGSYISQYKTTTMMDSSTYQRYLSAVQNIDNYISLIAVKESELLDLEFQILTTKEVLTHISDSLNISNHLNKEQLDELLSFENEGEAYEDSTFAATDIMTQEEILDMKIELLRNAEKELARASKPRVTTTATISNIYTLRDEKDSLISYEEWRSKFDLGNIVSLKFRDDYFTTVRIVSIAIDFDNIQDLEITLSDKNRLDDSLTQHSELLAQAGKTSSSYTLGKIGYNEAAKQRNEIREFMNSSLNAATNAMHNNDKVEVEFGKYGIKNREWLENESRYSDYQSWWNNNTLLFSSDGFKTSKTGIGLFKTETDEEYYGVIANVLVGELLLTSAINIKNESNNIILDKNGARFQDCDIQIDKDGNSIRLNAENGIEIYNGINRQLWLDVDGNLVTQGKITGGSININNKFTVDELGNFKANNAILSNGQFTGDILSSRFIGGSIESDNYLTNNLGMKINLSDGSIDSKNFKISSEGNLSLSGHADIDSGHIAGFNILPQDATSNDGGLLFTNDELGKFIRISPYSSLSGTGTYNTNYGAIDLGLAEDGNNTLVHLRSDGYARFGLVAEGGYSVRFNDFLRAQQGVVGASDTILYSQNFSIGTDGTVHIKSPDIPDMSEIEIPNLPEAAKALRIGDDFFSVTTESGTTMFGMVKNSKGQITAITQGNETIPITWD